MAKEGFGLFKRGQDKPILASGDADLLQRTRKREYGNDPDYKVAPLGKAPHFAEPAEPAASNAGLEQRMAEARQAVFEEKITEAVRAEVEDGVSETVDEAGDQLEEIEGEQTSDVDELTGDALAERAEAAGVDTSTGGSRTDGGLTADETRAAIKEAEQD